MSYLDELKDRHRYQPRVPAAELLPAAERCDWCWHEAKHVRVAAKSVIDEAYHGMGRIGPTSLWLRACDEHRELLEAYG